MQLRDEVPPETLTPRKHKKVMPVIDLELHPIKQANQSAGNIERIENESPYFWQSLPTAPIAFFVEIRVCLEILCNVL